MPGPWTQSVTLKWAPELRFFETRYAILRHLEENGSMWSFRTAESFVEARLADLWHQLSVTADRASMHLLAPAADPEIGWDALEHALGQVRPKRPHSMACAFQYIVGVDYTFEEAIDRAYRSVLLTSLKTPGLTIGDWAIMADLKLDELPDVVGQTEFGIIRRNEIPDRLGRSVSRISYADPPTVDANVWDSEDAPDVGIFADTTFLLRLPTTKSETSGAFDDVREFAQICRERGTTLVEALKSQLDGTDAVKEVAS